MYKRLKRLIAKFDNWMDFNPPGAMSATGWRLFGEEFKEVAPIRYWIKHDFVRGIVWPIQRTFNNAKFWIRYRTTHRYHVVETGLKPGYNEVETVMLYTSFNLLKNFVEVELASHSPDREVTWCERHMPFYRLFYPFRRPDLGMKVLDWKCSLDDPSLPVFQQSVHEAADGREIRTLYKWWVEDRPARKRIEIPAYSMQGKGDLGIFDDDFDREAEDYKAYEKARAEAAQQGVDWRAEEQTMLERLIKVRQSLWS